jgi:type II secretion system protein G
MKYQRGFTLLEMMVVVAIIAILAAILIPNFTRARAQTQTAACMGNIKMIATALELYFTDTGNYPAAATPTNVQTLGLTGYLNQTPIDPAGSGSYTVKTQTNSGNGGVAGYQIWCPGAHDPATLTKIAGATTNTHLKFDNQTGFSTVSAQNQ